MRRLSLPAVLLAGSCAWNGDGPGCEVVEGPHPLAEELRESSGVAPSALEPGVFWTHADGSVDAIWAVDALGATLARVELEGARAYDAEDIAVAACPEGSCLYLADIGDNYAERDTIAVLRIVEPPPESGSVTPRRFRMRLPDGPRDAEAIFVLPSERLFLVTKGSEAPITVYRYPGPLREDTVVTLEEVQRLSDTPRVLPRQVTGAAASPDGETVVLRTYETLLFHRMDADTLVLLPDGTVNLRSLREAQGEGVGLVPGGLVALTSEGGLASGPGSLVLMRCRLESPE